MFLWTRRGHSIHSCWNTFARYHWVVSSKSEKVEEYIFYQFFPKESSGHIKCSFEEPAKTFFDKNPKIILEVSKKIKTPLNCSSGYVEGSFDIRAVKHPQKVKQTSLKVRNCLEIFFLERFSSERSLGHVDGSYDTLAKSNAANFPLNISNW